MENVNFSRRLIVPAGLALVGLFLLIWPVVALGEDPNTSVLVPDNQDDQAAPAAVIGGADIALSNLGSGSPVIEVSNDGVFVAAAYYKIGRAGGGVHLKSATATDGWLTTRYLGAGQNPSLVFSTNSNNRVFVVWQVANKTIRFADCTLALKTQPSCASGDIVTVTSGNLDAPDIVVDSANPQVLHVAWVQDGDIRTARSGNSGQSWQTLGNITSGASNDFETPRLAAANGFLHLAFRRKSSADNLGKAIEYHRAANPATHNWSKLKDFGLGAAVNGQYDDLANPTIVASGSNVYLAWDAQSDAYAGDDDDFGLMRVKSTDDGFSWGTALHITNDTNASLNVQNPSKVSRKIGSGVVPVQEGTLRPSMAPSGSGVALVWQQRAVDGVGCQEAGDASSEIYFAATDNVSWVADTMHDNSGGNDNENQYSIDPDLAVDNSGVEHFVFMKDADTGFSCIGGEASAYKIFYRGPFTIIINDKGEDPADPDVGPPTIYLPIISKS